VVEIPFGGIFGNNLCGDVFFYNIVGCMLLNFVLYVGEVLGKLR
jgi:hypothetical protein